MKVRWTNYLVFKTNHNFPFLFSAFSLTSIYLNLEFFYCTHAVIGTGFALNMLFNIDPLSITAIWGSLPYSIYIMKKLCGCH